MRLSPPSFPVFIISLAIAALVVAARYGGVHIPVASSNPVESMLVAYVILLAGNVLRSF